MNPDGSSQRIFAKGLRNAVSLKWIGKFLFATNQGVDHLGLEKPDETFYALKDGADYGWASCYQSNGKVFRDPKYNRLKDCANVPTAYAYFPAHGSALGFDYFDDANSDAAIKDSFLVSLHGSTNKNIGHGYKVVLVRKGEKLQDFISGFLQDKTVLGRPCDIMKLDANSFLFTDDYSGIVYYVRKKDWKTQANANQTNLPEESNKTTPANSEISKKKDEPKNKTCFSFSTVLIVLAVWAAKSVFIKFAAK